MTLNCGLKTLGFFKSTGCARHPSSEKNAAKVNIMRKGIECAEGIL
jgi:hypothetical protein